MIGIDCYNKNDVCQTLDLLKNKGRTYADGLYNEIMTAIEDLGYPVVITDEENVGYFFGEYKEEDVEIIDFKDYINNLTIETHNKLKEKEIKKMKIENNSKVEYLELYHNLSNLYLTSPIPKEMLKDYLYGDEDEQLSAELEMIEFIAGHLKDEIAFSASFPIMDAIESIIDSNAQSGNIQLIGLDKLK